MRSLFLGIISGAALLVAAIPVAAQVVLPPGQTAYDVAAGTQDITQQITGTGGINKTGNGILQFSYTGTPATDYSGPTNVIAGTLSAFGANTLSAVSAVTVNGGATLSISGENRIASLAGAGTVRKNGLILTVGGDNTSTTFSGVLE